MGRPSGTVTFLFTDIEGSTAAWAADPDAMGAAVARHDELVRKVVDAHDGYVFTTAGDSFAVAFHRAEAAVLAALDLQAAVTDEHWPTERPLKVRMGIQTGEADERDGDYFGPALNLAARVMSAAHGGQILLGPVAVDLLRTAGRDDLIDLGDHVLAGIPGLVRLTQVGHGEFPPPRSTPAVRTNLPSSRSSFIGRRAEVARVRELLRHHRLVTLTGVGGTGKTRLAVEAARDAVRLAPDGIFFVDLAKVGDDEQVPGAFATAVGVALDDNATVTDQVISRIGSEAMLLVVDNCEHVVDAVADLLDEVLDRSPNVLLLATTREPLDLEGERVVRVPPLGGGADDPRQDDGVRLFLERSGENVDASDDELISDVVEICSRLDGLPLAIELAASRTTALSPAQIRDRLDDRFALLTAGRRRTRGRQQTLEAAIAWSYEQAADDERLALQLLSILPGSFDLDLAAAVLDVDEAGALDVLDALVRRSLVSVFTDHDDGAVRYRLLETIRVYAHAVLIEAGVAEAAHRRHADRIIERIDAARIGPNLGWNLTEEMTRLMDDAMAALDWARAQPDAELVARLCIQVAPLFLGRGMLERGRDLVTWAIDHLEDRTLIAQLRGAESAIAMMAGDFPTQAASARAALELAVPGPHNTLAANQYVLASFLDVPGTERFLDDREASNLNRHDPYERLCVAYCRGFLCALRGNWQEAFQHYGRIVTAHVFHATPELMARAGHLLACVALGRLDEAATQAEVNEREWPVDAAIELVNRGEQWLDIYPLMMGVVDAAAGAIDRGRSRISDVFQATSGGSAYPLAGNDFAAALAACALFADERQVARSLLAPGTYWAGRSPEAFLLGYWVLHQLEPEPRPAFDAFWLGAFTERTRDSRAVERERRGARAAGAELARLGTA